MCARSATSYKNNLYPVVEVHKNALMWVPEQLSERIAKNKNYPKTLVLEGTLGFATSLSASHVAEWNDYLDIVRAGLPAPVIPAGTKKNELSLLAMHRALAFWQQKRADGSPRFSKLLPIALRILSIPLGVGAVERSFNQTRTQQAVRRLNQSHDNREYEAYLVHNRRFLKTTLALVQQ